MKTILPLTLTTKQVFDLWSTESESLQLVDLRPASQFETEHIPGSLNLKAEQIAEILRDSEGEKLWVLICDHEEASRRMIEDLKIKDLVVMRGGLSEWKQKYPTTKNRSELKGATVNPNLRVHQLFEHESSTFTYLVWDAKTREAILIDPVLETVERDIKLITELGVELKYVLDTHIHADHITGAGEIRRRTGAKTAVSKDAKVDCVDISLSEGQELQFGANTLKVYATPGHTDSCLSFYVDGRIFTGDALLVRGTGRTDFQQGSSEKLYDSIVMKLFNLPEDTIVYPAHDYKGHTRSSIWEEKRHNPRIGAGKSKEQFVAIMSELKLANPKKIHEALPANMACGSKLADKILNPAQGNGIPEVTCEEVRAVQRRVKLIDVRRPEEYNNEYGHIEGSELKTLGPELEAYLSSLSNKDEQIVFVCRSGARSGQATATAQQLGFTNVINMVGGMIRWNEVHLPVVRNEI